EALSPVWKQNSLCVAIEVPRGAEAFLGLGITYPEHQDSTNRDVLHWHVLKEITSRPDLIGGHSNPDWGWPIWWRLDVIDGDRLQDLQATEALYKATHSGKAETIAARIVTLLRVTDQALSENA